jgi:hypothetical protein
MTSRICCIAILIALANALPAQTVYIEDNNPALGAGNSHPWGQANGFTTLHVYFASQLAAGGVTPGATLTDIQVVPSIGGPLVYSAPTARLSVGHINAPIVAGMWEANIVSPTVIHDVTSGPFTFPWTNNTFNSLPGVAAAGFVWDGIRDICIFYTSSAGTSGTFTARRTTANPRHSVTVYGATTEAPTSVAPYAMKVALTFLPGPPLFQVNQPGAAFQLNTSVGNAAIPSIVTTTVGTAVNVSFMSTNIGSGFDLALTSPEVLVANGSGALLTLGGQLVNIDIAAPSLIFLNNFAFPPFPGNFNTMVTGTGPAQLSAQMIVISPGTPDGFVLSGPSRLIIL